jgi:membrane protein implicated in regulation of membrane protease activity
MPIWIWIVIAVIAIVGEMVTTGLFLASVAVAAIAAAIIALVLPFAVVQLAVFGAVALGGIAFIRPLVVQALGMDSLAQISGQVSQSHIVGRRALVTRTVDAHAGQVRIGEGEFWTARAFDPSDVLPTGSTAEIVLVDGLTALVEPVHDTRDLETENPLLTEKGT